MSLSCTVLKSIINRLDHNSGDDKLKYKILKKTILGYCDDEEKINKKHIEELVDSLNSEDKAYVEKLLDFVEKLDISKPNDSAFPINK
jgi:hypothetical protein